MKTKLLLSCVMFFLSFSLSVQASWDAAAAEVETSIEAMLEKVTPYRGQVDADLEPLYQSLAEITQNSVDYPYLSKLVMGKYYRRASTEQKLQFQNVFQRTLIKTYAKTLVSFNIKDYKLQKNKTLSPKTNKQKIIVQVASSDGKEYTLINYMVLKDGQWKLVNIVLDGFNLRVTFKNQFSSMAQKAKGNIGSAIEKWSDSMSKK